MAIIHQATITPSKLELVATHLVAMPHFADLVETDVWLIGAYRFDDPAGRVGIETHIVSAGTHGTVQVPMTYRETPLEGADRWLINTMDHSALGKRWIYHACGDPIYVSELVRTILTGDTHVGLWVETENGPVERDASATVVGSGSTGADVPTIVTIESTVHDSSTVINAAGIELVVRHRLDGDSSTGRAHLSGQWDGTDEPVTLAYLA